MGMRTGAWVVGVVVVLAVLSGCRQNERRDPPPDAARPVLKTQAELESERAEQIGRGEVVETTSPTLVADESPAPTVERRRVTPLRPNPGAISSDILMVNEYSLTVAEILYPLWEELEGLWDAHTAAGFRERARQLVQRETRREIGSLLIYAEAVANVPEERRAMLDAAVEGRIESIQTQSFGGSRARLEAYVRESGLSMAQYRGLVKREMVVREYTREKLLPLVQIRRSELLEYFQQNKPKFESPGTRELLMMEFPFEAYLADGVPWASASRNARAAARLTATRQARAAHEALAERPFDAVAREYGRGLKASDGGSWGMIGQPLKSPYDEVSARVFEYETGVYSEPLEIEGGWVIVGCGEIKPARKAVFADVQEEIRQTLMEKRFNRLSVEYVLELAEDATISSLEEFTNAAVRRAEMRLARENRK
jgi:hypothetical protein